MLVMYQGQSNFSPTKKQEQEINQTECYKKYRAYSYIPNGNQLP
jgi:hypothetical protein